jgi:signal transduction histidine kinase
MANIDQCPCRKKYQSNGEEISIDGETYITSTETVTDSGWSVVTYHSLGSLKVFSFIGILFTIGLVLLSTGTLIYIRHRRRYIKKIKDNERMIMEVNRDLQRSDKIKGEYLSIIAHDIGSPLAAARGYLELMKDGMFGDLENEHEKTITLTICELDRINEIRKDSMDINRENRSRSSLNVSRFDINEMIGNMVERFSMNPNTGQRKIHFSPLIDGNIEADESKLKTAIENYVSNAIRYSPDASSIQIGIERTNQELIVWVQDEGRGLKEEDLSTVFEIFFRAGRKVKGSSGLGLAIVKGMVERHNGKVWASSNGLGKGSTFYLSIPIVTN